MDKDFLQNFQTPQYTPDLFLLEQAPNHLVLNPGLTWMGSPALCTGYTVDRMALWRKEKVFALPVRGYGPSHHVAGTLQLLDEETLVRLDSDLRNGVLFDRKRTPVLLPEGKTGGCRTLHNVWMYIAKRDAWVDNIEYETTVMRNNGCPYDLAETYSDEVHVLNNHYRFDVTKIEDVLRTPDPCRMATEEVISYIDRANCAEIQRLRDEVNERKKRAQVEGWFRRCRLL